MVSLSPASPSVEMSVSEWLLLGTFVASDSGHVVVVEVVAAVTVMVESSQSGHSVCAPSASLLVVFSLLEVVVTSQSGQVVVVRTVPAGKPPSGDVGTASVLVQSGHSVSVSCVD